MDYGQLKQLKALRREAEGLKYSIDHAKPEIVTDYYKDYKTGRGIPKSLLGLAFDEKGISSRERRLKRKLDEISRLIEAIEKDIEAIDDPDVRTILRMYYIEEMNYREIEKQTFMSKSTIQRKLKKFAEDESWDKWDKKV
ncbi:MAG: sigma-70 family RNA polymerase sigma factor [[Eubacterium] sulci]|nr:sigma-70 family RNA polymerase sigma factor [[Eubacterium] sulci]